MGRLFWKFFAFTWLAQLGGIIAISATFWLADQHADRTLDIASGPAAGTQIKAAASILRFGGVAGFKAWEQQEPRVVVFSVDAAGNDVLGRQVPPILLSEARQLHERDPTSPLVSDFVDADGRPALLFAAEHDHPGRPGPPPPPHGPPGEDSGPGDTLHRLPPMLPTLITLSASLLTAVLLAWYFAKPIRSLRYAFGEVAAGNLGLRVAPLIGPRQDELADLGRDFDRMAERLHATMEAQRRLLHDVSHEVRSPLARLQAAVGLLRRHQDREQPVIDRIEEEIERIDRLVGDLLKLSRIEAGELAGVEEEFDMRELVSEIVSDANFEMQSTGRAVVWTDETPATLRGRPEILRVAVENIVRNAFKHAPDSASVELQTSIDDRRREYVLRVLDRGPGVPKDELPSLFTAFYRSARSAATEGYGLGLAIARRSVEAHGGSIRARNRAGGGLEVVIALPLPGSDMETFAG